MGQHRVRDEGEKEPSGNLRERIAQWFRKLRSRIVMDAPPDWDVHPDVERKIRERDEP